MIEYSILSEAYPNFTTSKKKKKEDVKENFLNDYTNAQDCYYSKYNIDLPDCKKENFENKTKCEPLQPPKYEIPISEESKKNFENAYKVSSVNSKNITNSDDFLNNSVKPYFNEELDVYYPIQKDEKKEENKTENKTEKDFLLLKLNSFKKLFENNHPVKEEKSDTSIKIQKNEENPNKIQEESPNNLLLNLFIFSFIGIIIIILCSQITKLATIIALSKKNDI